MVICFLPRYGCLLAGFLLESDIAMVMMFLRGCVRLRVEVRESITVKLYRTCSHHSNLLRQRLLCMTKHDNDKLSENEKRGN